jgi:hypothetical protein
VPADVVQLVERWRAARAGLRADAGAALPGET